MHCGIILTHNTPSPFSVSILTGLDHDQNPDLHPIAIRKVSLLLCAWLFATSFSYQKPVVQSRLQKDRRSHPNQHLTRTTTLRGKLPLHSHQFANRSIATIKELCALHVLVQDQHSSGLLSARGHLLLGTLYLTWYHGDRLHQYSWSVVPLSTPFRQC